jgi:hypothetical protein
MGLTVAGDPSGVAKDKDDVDPAEDEGRLCKPYPRTGAV